MVAAVAGAFISIRWILVHTVPPDPGSPAGVGLHLYTWALLVFLEEMITASLNLMFARELNPQCEIEFGWLSRPCSGC